MPEDWTALYAAGETPWEKGEPSPGLVEWLERNSISGETLIPGCGYGHDVRAVASRGAIATGLDIADNALEKAREFPAKGLARYENGDFLQLASEHRDRYDWVIEHTLFCAIDPKDRDRYVESVYQALKPTGKFLAVFFMNPDLDPGESGPPFGSDLTELDQRFNPYFDLIEDWIPSANYNSRIDRERMRIYSKKPNATI